MIPQVEVAGDMRYAVPLFRIFDSGKTTSLPKDDEQANFNASR